MRTDKNLCRILLAILLLLAGSGPLMGQDLSSTQSDWKVGLAVLVAEDDSDPVVRSTASLLTRLLMDELSGTDFHVLTSAEQETLAMQRLNTERTTIRKSLASLYSSRDTMLFDPNSDPAIKEDRDIQIIGKTELLKNLDNYPTSVVTVPDLLPVIFPENSVGNSFFSPVLVNADSFRREKGLDVLIHGNIARVGDYFGLKLLSTSSDGTDVLWEGAVSEDGLDAAVDEAAKRARGLLLGRNWSALEVRVEPSDAVISIDDRIVGVGLWHSTTLSPGTYTLGITALGYSSQVLEIVLPQDDVLTMDVLLEATDRPSILIDSEPAGADVRLGSIWLGKTPMAVDLPDRVMSLTFEMDGFNSRTVPFYPEAERLTVPLTSAILDPVERMAISRKKLNNAMAWFSLSLAPTMILLGVSQNYAYMNLYASSPADIQYSYDAYNLSRGLMWGSVGINVVLLTTVLFRLSAYLKAAEGLSE